MSKQTTANGVIYLSVSSLIFSASGYALNVVLGRTLTPAVYGEYSVLIALATIFNLLQTSGLPQALSLYAARHARQAYDALIASSIIQLALTLGTSAFVWLAAPVLALLLNDRSLIEYIRILALVFPIYGMFALLGGYHNGLHNFRRQAIMNGAYSIAKVTLVIGFALAYGLKGAVVGFVLAPLIALPLGYAKNTEDSSNRSLPYRWLIIQSIPLMAFALFSTLQLNIDLFAAKSLGHSDVMAGNYAVALTLASLLYFGLNALGAVIYPTVASLHDLAPKKAARVVRRSFEILLVMTLPATALIAAYSNNLVTLLFGSKYIYAGSILAILIVAYAFITAFSFLANALNGLGSSRYSSIIAAIGVLITLTLAVILIPVLGVAGAALANVTGGAVILIAVSVKLSSRLSYIPNATVLTKAAVLAVGLYFLGRLITVPPLVTPLLMAVLLMTYWTGLIVVRAIPKQDVTDAIAVLSRRKVL